MTIKNVIPENQANLILTDEFGKRRRAQRDIEGRGRRSGGFLVKVFGHRQDTRIGNQPAAREKPGFRQHGFNPASEEGTTKGTKQHEKRSPGGISWLSQNGEYRQDSESHAFREISCVSWFHQVRDFFNREGTNEEVF